MSLYPGEEQVSSEIEAQFRADTVYNYPYFQPQSYEEKQNLNGLMNYYYQDGDHAVTVKGKLCGVYTPGLVLQALAMKIARAMGMPFDCIFPIGMILIVKNITKKIGRASCRERVFITV